MTIPSKVNIERYVLLEEQLRINNINNGPSLYINQTSNENVVDIQQNNSSFFYIENDGNVGIGTNNPNSRLHVNGIITGNGSQITNLNYDNITNQPEIDNVSDTNFDLKLSNKTTTNLIEGSNLYYTNERVEQHILSKNLISLTNSNLNNNELLYYTGDSWCNLKLDETTLEITTDNKLKVIGGTSSGGSNNISLSSSALLSIPIINENSNIDSNYIINNSVNNYIIFEYNSNIETLNQTEYNINFSENTKCDILLLDDTNYNYLTTQILKGNYTIKVGINESSITNDIYNENTSNATDISTGYVSEITGTTETYTSKKVIIKYSNEIFITTKLESNITLIPSTIENSSYKYLEFNESCNIDINIDSKFDILIIDENKYSEFNSCNLSLGKYNLVINENSADYNLVEKSLEINKTNLIAHWKFDGNSDDSSGNNHLVIDTGTPTYDTNNEYIIADNDISFTISNPSNIITTGQTAMTISFWVNNWTTTGYIMRYRPSNIVIWYNGSSQLEFSSEGQTMQYNSFSDITSWTLLTIVCDGNNYKLYINAINKDTISGSGNFDTGFTHDTSDNIWGIFENPSGTPSFKGHLKDLRFYNKVLTEQEISDIYNDTEPKIEMYIPVSIESTETTNTISNADFTFKPTNTVFDGTRTELFTDISLPITNNNSGFTIILKVERNSNVVSWDAIFDLNSGTTNLGDIYLAMSDANTLEFRVRNPNSSNIIGIIHTTLFTVDILHTIIISFNSSTNLISLQIGNNTPVTANCNGFSDRTYTGLSIGNARYWNQP